MAGTRICSDVNSDLSPFAEFSKRATASESDGSITVSIGGSATLIGGWIVESGKPNSDIWEDGGTWTLEIETDTGNMFVDGRARCVRLDSAGNVLQVGAYTSAQDLGPDRTFSPVAPTWTNGEEACGNRLAIEFEMVETGGMPRTLVFGTGTVASELAEDITEDAGSCAGAAGQPFYIRDSYTMPGFVTGNQI